MLGKTGIGLGKRAASPSASERLAKMAKMAEVHTQEDFRDRARREYEERRAEGRLAPAQRTCTTLDEKAGREVRLELVQPSLYPSLICCTVQRLVAQPDEPRYVPRRIYGCFR